MAARSPERSGVAPEGTSARRRANAANWAVGAVVAVLIGGGTIFTFTSQQEAVGHCVTVEFGGQLRELSCDDPQATYSVDAFYPEEFPCAGGDTLRIISGGGTGITSTPGVTRCMSINARDGDCYTGNINKPLEVWSKTTCGTGNIRVLRVLHGQRDTAACGPDADRSVAYNEPPKVVCLAEN